MIRWTHTARESRANLDGAEIVVIATSTGWHYVISFGNTTIFSNSPYPARSEARLAAIDVAREELAKEEENRPCTER